MATHQANIDNLRTATLGEQVRGSMIQLFEEDYNLVKRGINVGTAVTSASSSTAGYYDGNLYINSATLDVWECNGSVWIRQGNLKGIADITETISPVDGGVNTITITLTDGTTKVLTVKNGETGADGANGVDGLSIADIELESSIGNAKTYKPVLSDGTKTPNGFTVTDGTSSYVHIRYSANFDGTGMVTVPTDATVYIGIVVTSQSVAPTDPSVYSWVRFIGKSGTGSGDMLAADYSTKYAGVVDKAAALYDGTNEIQANQLMDKTVYDADNDGVVDNAEHATNADNVGNADTSLLEKLSDSYGKLNYNGNALMLEAAQLANQAKLGEFTINQISNNVKELALHSDITTKLSKVDNKIDKPTSATEGQVLTYNGTSNEWEAKNPSASITEPTELEKGIIGGDAWIAKSYTAGSTVIYNNKIYSCIADCGASNPPTDKTYWEETSLGVLTNEIANLNKIIDILPECTVNVTLEGNPDFISIKKNGNIIHAVIRFTTPSTSSNDFVIVNIPQKYQTRKRIIMPIFSLWSGAIIGTVCIINGNICLASNVWQTGKDAMINITWLIDEE